MLKQTPLLQLDWKLKPSTHEGTPIQRFEALLVAMHGNVCCSDALMTTG